MRWIISYMCFAICVVKQKNRITNFCTQVEIVTLLLNLSWPAASTLFNAAKVTVILLNSKDTLLNLCSTWFLLVLLNNFLQICFPTGYTQHVPVQGVVPLQVQDNALAFAELHETLDSQPLQPVEVSLDGSIALWSVIHSHRFQVICNIFLSQ